MKICKNCGTSYEDGDYCPTCGQPQTATDTATSEINGSISPVQLDGTPISQQELLQAEGIQPPNAPPSYTPPEEMHYQTYGANDYQQVYNLGDNGYISPPKFSEGALGIIIIAVIGLFTLCLATIFGDGIFFRVRNFSVIVTQFLVFVPLAVGFILTVRAGGADISIPGIMAMATMIFGASGSIIVTVIFAVIAGVLNAVLVSLLKLPSLAITLVTGALFRGIAIRIGMGSPIHLERPSAVSAAINIVGIIAIVIGFLYVTFSGIDGKKNRPGVAVELKIFITYIIAGILAGVGGIMMTMHLSAAIPNIGSSYEIDLMLLLMIMGCSLYFDSNIIGMVIGIAGALMLTIQSNVLMFIDIDYRWAQVLKAITVIIIAIPASFVFRRKYIEEKGQENTGF